MRSTGSQWTSIVKDQGARHIEADLVLESRKGTQRLEIIDDNTLELAFPGGVSAVFERNNPVSVNAEPTGFEGFYREATKSKNTMEVGLGYLRLDGRKLEVFKSYAVSEHGDYLIALLEGGTALVFEAGSDGSLILNNGRVTYVFEPAEKDETL